MQLIQTEKEHLVRAAAVLVPVKAFADAKGRLAPVLSEAQRVRLMQNLTARVIAAAHPYDVAVVCDDDEVAKWARDLGALVIWTPTRGLNGAVRDGVDALAELGYENVIIAHGDLVAPQGLSDLLSEAAVVIVPDVRQDGTNVLIVPTAVEFTFSYGPQSFAAHLREAKHRDLSVEVIAASPLQYDVDEPSDLAGLDLAALLK